LLQRRRVSSTAWLAGLPLAHLSSWPSVQFIPSKQRKAFAIEDFEDTTGGMQLLNLIDALGEQIEKQVHYMAVPFTPKRKIRSPISRPILPFRVRHDVATDGRVETRASAVKVDVCLSRQVIDVVEGFQKIFVHLACR